MAESSSWIRDSGETAPLPVPVLDDILKIGGVLGTLLVRSDGTVVATAGYFEQDTRGFAASIALLMVESGIIADRIQEGPLSMICIEFENILLMVQEIDYDRFMVVVARPGANVGKINYHLKKQRQIPVPAV